MGEKEGKLWMEETHPSLCVTEDYSQVSGEREAPGEVSVGAVKVLIGEVTSRPVFPSSPALPDRHPALTTATLLCGGLGSIFHIPAYCPDSLSSHITREQSSATGW